MEVKTWKLIWNGPEVVGINLGMSNSLAITPGGLPWTLKYTIDSHVKVYYRPTIIIVKSLSTWQSTRFGSKSPLTTPDSVSQSDSRQWNSFAQFITKPEQIRLHKTINPKTTTSYCWSFEQSKVQYYWSRVLLLKGSDLLPGSLSNLGNPPLVGQYL